MSSLPRVGIVGAGFGGLRAAHDLATSPAEVWLVDQHNYHTFQPLLYQVATAGLSPEEIAHNVRDTFHKQRNFHFRLGRVVGVDWNAGELIFSNGSPQPFDFLILTPGSVTNDFGIPGVKQYAFPLKGVEDAVRLRSHILRQFEIADADPETVEQGAPNLVVVGGGPTGVEMAGALSELVHVVLRKDHPNVDVGRACIYVVEATDKLLAPFSTPLRENALDELRRRGIQVLLGEAVVKVTPDSIHLRSGRDILTRTVIWSAGVKASPLGALLGLPLTRSGRVAVNLDLSVPGHPHVFVAGDMAASRDPQGNLYPQLAQVAIQGARHASRQVVRGMRGESGESFIYHDPGMMATIGRNAAVVRFPNGWRFRVSSPG